MLARYGAALTGSALFHACVAAGLGWAMSVPPPRAGNRAVRVVLLPPAEDSTFPGLKPVDRADPGWNTGDFPAGSQLAGADLDRIAADVAVLFPFVTPGLAIDAFFPSAAASQSRLIFADPFTPSRPRQAADEGRHLEMSAAAVQALIDHAWSRGRRWDAFAPLRNLIETHRADDERLALLVRLYREQNALQPYADGAIRDLRLWAELGLAADHASFIAFVRDYAAAHPSTKVTTELLLLLDTIAQANQDVLAFLVETDRPGDLDWTRLTHPRAYRMARQIQRQYARALVSQGLTSRRAVETFYADRRLALLTRTLTTTPNGYRSNDLRFLIGSILWTQGHPEQAVSAWRQMTAPADDLYAESIRPLRVVLEAERPDARAIGYILRNQEGRWASFSNDRLKRFGYRADAY